MTKQFLICGTSESDMPALDGGAVYSTLLGDGTVGWETTEAVRESIISTPGKLSNFKVGVAVAPGVGASWTFTVRKAASGAAMADTTLSVTISDTNVLSSLDTDEVVVTAGDRVTIKVVRNGTPANAEAIYWTCQFTPDTDGETILLSNSGTTTLVTGYFNALIGSNTSGGFSIEFRGQTLFPTAGTLKKFYVELTAAPGAGKSRTFTIRKNGVATSLIVTISGTDTTGSDTDSAHNVTIAAGDLVTIVNAISGVPAATQAKFGTTFLPDTLGEFITSATTVDPTSTTTNEYQHLNCGQSTLTATEAEQHNLAQKTTAKAMYVNLETAPGASYSWIFTLRDDLADTGLTVTISDTNKSGNAATDVAIEEDSLLDTFINATAGLATSRSQIAYLFLTIKLPTVSTDPATPIGAIKATLNGTLTDDGGESCDCGFEYGLTTAYGETTSTESKNTNETFSQNITGLLANRVYHFRAFATNSIGTSYGSDRTFRTTALGSPIIDQLIFQHAERMRGLNQI